MRTVWKIQPNRSSARMLPTSETLPCLWRPRVLWTVFPQQTLTWQSMQLYVTKTSDVRLKGLQWHSGQARCMTALLNTHCATDCRFTLRLLQDKEALVFTSTFTGRWGASYQLWLNLHQMLRQWVVVSLTDHHSLKLIHPHARDA